MKRLIVLIGIAIAGLICSIALLYAPNPDSFEVSCTPSVIYSVTISTPSGGLAFGSVNINETYVHSSTATITNSGNVTADWKIRGVGLNVWTLGATPGSNVARLLGALKDSLAASNEFSVTDDVITSTEGNMDNTHYTVNQTGNDVPKNEQRLLSIRLDTPTDTTVDTEQKFRIEIKAYPSSTF